MMRGRHILCAWLLFLCGPGLFAQTFSISGKMTDPKGNAMPGGTVELYPAIREVREIDEQGEFIFEDLETGTYRLSIRPEMADTVIHREVELKSEDVELVFRLDIREYELRQVVIREEGSLGTERLSAVDGMGIYASKKNEIIRIESLPANLATNNSRQVFARVPGLNIWESDGAGLQLGIGARGLSPNRTSNFNTRQNGYDISADALGYPESYYSPPVEAIDRIEVVRGAASLQYGTQFGGMINFVFREGPKDKAFEFTSRNTAGSFGFLGSFNSIGGTKGKLNYYAFYQRKHGNGWRPNSGFDTHTAFTALKLDLSSRLKVGVEYTYMHYLAQQPGGLTDAQFQQDPRQSIRERNWFRVDWNLAAVTLDYHITENTRLNVRNFGLFARREALGFLGLINRIDPLEERDLICGYFRNLGNETRLIHKYDVAGQPGAFLAGIRLYRGYTESKQGYASDAYGPDFAFLNPDDLEHSEYRFPSRNISAFAENVFFIGPKFSLTPGIRYEYIFTGSEGYYKERETDLAGNILYENTIPDAKERSRQLVLAGFGMSYRPHDAVELYANISQNYRAINFNDLRIVNPNFRIDENLHDERGFNADLGLRGVWKNAINYDVSAFYLRYQDRIGLVLKVDPELYTLYRYRTNVADSRTLGVEAYAEADLLRLIRGEGKSVLSLFANVAAIDARYVNSDEPAIDGNFVELAPPLTVRSGISFSRGPFRTGLQGSYTAAHFTDATNAALTATAVNGEIPAYYVLDLSASYEWRMLRLEGSVNNLTNAMYFTRRAAAYPGPGIIPSDGRAFFLTLQVKL